MNNELYHHGIKGMKWGVRRYQNKDGSLTKAGEKRYAKDSLKGGFDKYDAETGTHYKENKKSGRVDNYADVDRYVKEDLQRSRNLLDSGANFSRQMKNISEKNNRSNKSKPMDLSNKTDKEMRDEINRLLLERQYTSMFTPEEPKKGRAYAKQFFDVATDALVLTSTALGIAVALKELKG